MAIQLARAIGMQRKPISPLEGLSDIITKTGQDITSSIEKKQEKEQAKEERKQALKDAMSANIKFDPIEATPQDQAEYENYARKGISELAVFRADPNVTPAQFQAKKDEFEYGLGERKIKYKADFDTLAEADTREYNGTHYTDDFKNYLIGTPDREEIVESEFPMNAPYKEKSMLDVEEESKENIAKPEKRIVKGEKGYFQLPFEERKKIDLRNELEKKSVVADVDALKASQNYFGGDFSPRNFVQQITTSKGATIFNVDEEGLENDAQRYASSFIGNTNYGKDHNIKKRNYETAAIRALEESGLDLTPENIANYKAKIAYKDFKRVSEASIADEIRKRREAKEAKGGMTFNFGNTTKTKQDTYTQGKYDTEKAATSLYDVNQYEKEYKKYVEKNKQILNQKATSKMVERKDLDSFYRKTFDKAQNDPIFDGKTAREVFIRANKKTLSNLEGKNFISFNNADTEKTATFFITEDNKLKKRPYFPSGVIYDDNGNILAIEASAAVKQENGQYVKNDQSLEIIPLDKDNYNELASRFPDLFKHAKENLKVDLKYSEGAAPAKQGEGKSNLSYEKWKSSLPEDLQNETDYDLKGFYEENKNNPNKLKPDPKTLHLTDKFKLPNHITFSEGSKYSNNEQKGGKWSGSDKTGWTFTVSPFNLSQHSVKEIQSYFAKYEKGNKLVFPKSVTMKIGDKVATVSIDKVDEIKSKYPEAKIY